jgi:hypothetical protein
MNPRVTQAEYKSKYKLIVTFSNGEMKEFDFSNYLQYPIYASLNDESFCKKLRVINGTVAWNDDIDFDPDRLYLESRSFISA